MKIHFLGTNGWFDTKCGNTVCTLIDCEEYYIILDAGVGIYKIDRFIKEKKPIYLFISHFHLDHIIGLHTLNKFNFKQDMHIFGQAGTKKILQQLMNKVFTAPFKKLSFKVKVHELTEGTHRIPFAAECRFLKHVSPCLGYRFNLENKVITYCTDTAYCRNAVYLSRNADLLISECSYKAGQKASGWPHLDPIKAARIAKEAKAWKLILTHFDADIYRTLAERRLAQANSRRIFPQAYAAYDGRDIKV